MILSGASALYGVAVGWRRQWYARDPARQRHLAQPVISVGNISSGGRGKSPLVAMLAAMLQAAGERPAILSRGYARRRRPEGVTVVSDGTRVIADVDTAGDEPLMLARALPGVPVLVASERYTAGALAESRFNVTVHLLDDGFQHLALARDVDLLVIDDLDLDDRVLPAGRLREPLGALTSADALLVPVTSSAASRLETLAPQTSVFATRRSLGPLTWVTREGPGAGGRFFAVAGIGRPQRFFDDLQAAGYDIAGRMIFRDHHWFTAADAAAISNAAAAAGAGAIVTTDKDAVRLESHTLGLPLARVPLTVTIDTPGFERWLLDRLQAARGVRSSPGDVRR